MREPSGKCRYKSQEGADEHPTNSYNKEVRYSSKHVDGLDGFHLAKRLEQVVQDLSGRKKEHRQVPLQIPHYCSGHRKTCLAF